MSHLHKVISPFHKDISRIAQSLLAYRHRRRCLVGIVMASGLFAMPVAAQEFTPCPSPAATTPTVTIAPEMLDDVCIPPDFAGNPIAYFDDFSWRAFLALVWPAKQDQRGKPDATLPVGTIGRPTVFETFKAEWEVFQPDGKAPAAWSKYDGDNPCNLTGIVFGDILLASFSKFSNLGMADFGPKLTGALVAQNATYVRYSVGFNESEFTTIKNKTAYLRASLASNVSFQSGAIDIKAAWIDMRDIPNPDRYYTRQAWLFDLESNACAKTAVGLVGLHIVVKTASRPQWIWTTFEHVDNVPPAPGAPGPFTFNDRSGTPMPADNPVKFPIPLKPPGPYNVERLKPIHPSTAATNSAYQHALQVAGSRWQFYQLGMTQWPRNPNTPSDTGSPSKTFPGSPPSDATTFSNMTMEAFEQKTITTGCMSCHNLARAKVDYLWSVMTRAHPSILVINSGPPPSPSAMTLSGQAARTMAPAPSLDVLPADQREALEALKALLATRN